jgi:hypothetical protein
MKISVIGARGGEVTGPACLLQAKTARIFVNCGLFQGGKPRVVLTHGENGPRSILARLIQQPYKLKPLLPELNEAVEL